MICADSVPTATAGGIPEKISKGVIRKPPPTPNRPERKPTAPPMAKQAAPTTTQSTTGNTSTFSRGPNSCSNTPQRNPPASPPRCPPIEMPGTPKVNARLMSRIVPRPLCQMLMPRDSCIATARPNNPKIAPEAPTVGDSGLKSITPNEPASSDTP